MAVPFQAPAGIAEQKEQQTPPAPTGGAAAHVTAAAPRRPGAQERGGARPILPGMLPAAGAISAICRAPGCGANSSADGTLCRGVYVSGV